MHSGPSVFVFAHSVNELFPCSVIEGEIGASDGQLDEVPLSLDPQYLSGKLRGPRGVGERNDPEFFD